MEMLSFPRIGIAAAQRILSGKAAARDDETQLAAELRINSRAAAVAVACAPPESVEPADNLTDAVLARVAFEITRSVESRLLGRVRDLRVSIDDGRFVLTGTSNSYYVKQLAQHLAMNALDAQMLGRLVNQIEVRSVR